VRIYYYYYFFFSEAKRTLKALALGCGLTMIFALLSLFSLQVTKPARAAATFTVNSTGDAGDDNPGNGSCFTGVFIAGSGFGLVKECTLRAAIEEANANDNDDAIVDAINFGIPEAGPHTISPAMALPDITEPVTIDGYTEPGASVNTATTGTNAVLQIVLNGSNAPDTAAGLRMTAGSTVKGLVINGFSTGVLLDDFEHDNWSSLEGNFIGTDATGNAAFANRRSGVFIVRCAHFIIGGDTLAARNLISGNGRDGIKLDSSTCSNEVQGNLIGTKKDGTTALGNGFFGMAVERFSSQVWRNTIAFNGSHGVFVSFGAGNAIFLNSIHSNGGLGIDLRGGTENADGVTANDPGDFDSGPNHLQNWPIITDAITSGTTTNISGRLNSWPDQPILLQFFSNPSGGNEGQRFIGEMGVTTDVNGDVRFTFAPARKVSVGRTITATAMQVVEDSTSEFSAPRTVGTVVGP
jgi:CSLREA domain-containing protein